MNVGVIGLGTMGGRMVDALLDAGHEVIVHDVSTAAVERTVAVGAKPARSGVEVGAAAQVVLLSLPLPEVAFSISAPLATSACNCSSG